MENQKKNTSNILFTIIAILLFVLTLEAGILIFKSSAPPPAQPQQTASHQTPPQGLGSRPSMRAFSRSVSSHARMTQPASPASQDNDMQDALTAMQRIQDRMNHMFDAAMMFGPPMAHSMFSDDLSGDFGFDPAFDVREEGNNYIVSGDLPGLEKDKINITVTGNQLSIEGRRENITQTKDEKTGFYSQERSYGSFARSLPLPGPVDETKIVADYKNGVLTITLPKAPGKEGQKVAVQ